MLTHLTIHRLAVVEHLELSFQSGMTVFSGETGAGKSILLDALGLTLGERAESSLIRPGHSSSEVSATYDITHLPAVQTFLSDHDFASNGECIIRRTLTQDGRSRAYINGFPATVQQLKDLGENLINLHSQHQHHALLKPQYQLALLDAYGQYSQDLDRVAKAYTGFKAVEKEIQILLDQQTHPEKLALFEYQLQELEELKLNPNEISELEKEHKNLSHAEQWSGLCQEILDCCEGAGGDSSGLGRDSGSGSISILQTLHQVMIKIKALNVESPALKNCMELFSSAIISLEEGLSELKIFSDNISSDPKRLNFIDERLSQIFNLARKHRVSPQQLFEHTKTLAEQAKNLRNSEATLRKLEEQLQKLKAEYQTAAQKLTLQRKKTGENLKKKIIDRLAHLELSQARFEVSIAPTETFSALGSDEIEFMISLNPGHPLQPLRKIASGGELSRISLAIQVITAEKMTIPSLIFDEVDVGVSGKTAEIVGKLLRNLAQNTQVLCVTHLPQVAAQGHQHYKVYKQQTKDSTTTQIQNLIDKEKISELARMLGGIQITENTLKHAQEMLEGVA